MKREKETRLTHGAVVFEGFGDLSAGQVAEVGHRGRSRELQVSLLGHNPGHRQQTLVRHAHTLARDSQATRVTPPTRFGKLLTGSPCCLKF